MDSEILSKIKIAYEDPNESSFSELARVLIRKGYPEKEGPPVGTHEFSFIASGTRITARLLSSEQEDELMKAFPNGCEGQAKVFITRNLQASIVRINGEGYSTPEQGKVFKESINSWNSILQRYCFDKLGEEIKRYEESFKTL